MPFYFADNLSNCVQTVRKDHRVKLLLVLWLIAAVLWLVYFGIACSAASNAAGEDWYKGGYSHENKLDWPEFLACYVSTPNKTDHEDTLSAHGECILTDPYFRDVHVDETFIKHRVLEKRKVNLKHVDDVSSWNCVNWNWNGKLGNTKEHSYQTIECDLMINGTSTTKHTARDWTIFVVSGEKKNVAKEINDEEGVPNGANRVVVPWNQWSRLGLSKSHYHTKHSNSHKLYDIAIDSLSFDGRADLIYGSHLPLKSITRVSFHMRTFYMWTWEHYNYYDFYAWLGFIGGAAYTIKMLFNLAYLSISFLFFKLDVEPTDRANYDAL